MPYTLISLNPISSFKLLAQKRCRGRSLVLILLPDPATEQPDDAAFKAKFMRAVRLWKKQEGEKKVKN